MAKRLHGKRVSNAQYTVLRSYEQKSGVAVQINQGKRTIAEQAAFYAHYLRYGYPLAAKPWGGAPHIKWGQPHHACDINAGNGSGQAQHVAAYYRSLGIPVSFNVRGEPWHMDVLDKSKLLAAARRLDAYPTLKRGMRRPAVITLKKLLYKKGMRNFSGRESDNRYAKRFGFWTERAVKRFQKREGLKPDGVVGPATWRKLRA